MKVNRLFLSRLRQLGTIEGISTLVLFGIAMPLKYMADMPMAVRVAGSIHGLLFVSLAVMLMMGVSRIPMSRGLALTGMVAAVFPFGPFVFDRWLVRMQAVSEGLESGSSRNA